jgi:hypothetical protein
MLLWCNRLSRRRFRAEHCNSKPTKMNSYQQRSLEESSPQEESTIVKIVLYPSQARPFSRLLPDARDRTGISGILCSLNQALDLNDGRLFLELQAARLDRRATLKIQELLRNAQEERSNAEPVW